MSDGFYQRHRPDYSDLTVARSILRDWEDEQIINRMKGDQLIDKWSPVPFAPLEREEDEDKCGHIYDPMLVDGKPKRVCCKCKKVI